MSDIGEVWKPLIGQIVWSVRRGVGTSITMEFGEPHLSIREPISPRLGHSERILQALKRRRVFVTGDWHFWIEYGYWRLTTDSGILEYSTARSSSIEECLADLDGQRLASTGIGTLPHSWIFHFDLNARLEIWPSKEIPDTQWSLHHWDGEIVACESNGALRVERAGAAPSPLIGR